MCGKLCAHGNNNRREQLMCSPPFSKTTIFYWDAHKSRGGVPVHTVCAVYNTTENKNKEKIKIFNVTFNNCMFCVRCRSTNREITRASGTGVNHVKTLSLILYKRGSDDSNDFFRFICWPIFPTVYCVAL